eukprot:14282839-Ditylum_brightwellii.AAC.1
MEQTFEITRDGILRRDRSQLIFKTSRRKERKECSERYKKYLTRAHVKVDVTKKKLERARSARLKASERRVFVENEDK